jgi:hypothetical protein
VEVFPLGRAAAVKLIRRALRSTGRTKALIFVNYRFEGHSPGTMNAIVSALEEEAA